MRSTVVLASVLSVCLATVTGCIVGDDESDLEVDELGAGDGSVGIQDGKLVRGTSKFRPRGLTLTGLVLSPKAAAARPTATYAKAHRELVMDFATQLARYKSWNVNTLRFQISQDALDPQSPQYDATYLPLIMQTLQQARASELIVIVSMRESMPGDFVDPCGGDKLPCGVTHRAWREVLTQPADIGHDRHYLLEIYNEPMAGGTVQNTEASWATWRPPHQNLVDHIRGLGAKNVLIADGIRAGKFLPLADKYKLSDPVGRMAYGIHPYPLLLANLSYYRTRDWLPAFGNFCDRGNACIATEWATGNDTACFDKTNNPNGVTSQNIARALIGFLHDHNIGSAVWPGDYPGSIVSDWQGTLSGFGTSFSCSNTTQHLGMGKMIKNYYVTGTPP
jgi:hypothetical protein